VIRLSASRYGEVFNCDNRRVRHGGTPPYAITPLKGIQEEAGSKDHSQLRAF
jgi:hypothetical protein